VGRWAWWEKERSKKRVKKKREKKERKRNKRNECQWPSFVLNPIADKCQALCTAKPIDPLGSGHCQH